MVMYGISWRRPRDDAFFAAERSGRTSVPRATHSGERSCAEDDVPQESKRKQQQLLSGSAIFVCRLCNHAFCVKDVG